MRELADGGVWDTLAGQPTDDSEMALALARSLIRNGEFSLNDIRAAYVRWYESGPFDIGHTTRCGLAGRPMTDSQGNGALMRISPLGIFGWQSTPEELAKLGELHRTDDHAYGRDIMNRTGPREGDVVAIRSTPKAKNGDVVVARLGDEVTLKRFVRLDERHVELRPDRGAQAAPHGRRSGEHHVHDTYNGQTSEEPCNAKATAGSPRR